MCQFLEPTDRANASCSTPVLRDACGMVDWQGAVATRWGPNNAAAGSSSTTNYQRIFVQKTGSPANRRKRRLDTRSQP